MTEKPKQLYFDFNDNIKQMRDTFIKRIGPTNGGHWEIIKEYNE